MGNPLWTMEAANLYCGSGPDDGNASNHLSLTELKLPGLDVQFVDHRAGGAPVAIEIDTVIARLECTFTLIGVTPQVMGMLGGWGNGQKNSFDAYGVIRDQATGAAMQAHANLLGMLSRADPQNWRRGDVMHTVYSIRGIVHYELDIAGEQIYLWDWATNTRIIGGTDLNAATNSLLLTGSTGITSATVNPAPLTPATAGA
jgi:uncharacterized protein